MSRHTPATVPMHVDDFTDAEVDEVLARFDRTEPKLQRRAIAGIAVMAIHLKDSNDELRAALEGCLSWLTSYPGHGADKAYEAARAALANTEGQK